MINWKNPIFFKITSNVPSIYLFLKKNKSPNPLQTLQIPQV